MYTSFYVVNQYHTKSAIFSFSPPKISMIKTMLSYYNSLINNNLITTTKCCRI